MESNANPYFLVRYFLEFGFEDVRSLATSAFLLGVGLDPFAVCSIDGRSLFSIAAEKRNGAFASLFLEQWTKNPDWSLHHEAYRLESIGAYDVLEWMNASLARIKDPHPIVNHLLNVLFLTLIR